MELAEEKNRYTYADFLEWLGPEHYELVEGEAYLMAAPDTSACSWRLPPSCTVSSKGSSAGVSRPLRGQTVPRADNSDDTVFEPDITAVCNRSKIYWRGCSGAPDFAAEIISLRTASYDKVLKFNRYQKAGIREYWMAEPESRTVPASALENGHYSLLTYDDMGLVPVTTLPGCGIDLRDVFADPMRQR
jgi:Uma2 family endonuclease